MVIPIALLIAGQYPLYYNWMVFLVAMPAFCIGFEKMALANPNLKMFTKMVASLLLLSGLLGLPSQLTRAVFEKEKNIFLICLKIRLLLSYVPTPFF